LSSWKEFIEVLMINNMVNMVTKIEKTEVNPWTIRIGSFIISIFIMISSWFLNQAWGRIAEIERSVKQLELSSASTSGNRFTSGDWTKAKEILDSERLSMDRRVIRLEESIPMIKETQFDIKKSIDEIKETLKTK
jgi:hypothetical protein